MKRILVVLLTVLPCLALTIPYRSTAASDVRTQVLQPLKDETLIESPTGALSSGKGPTMFAGRTGQPEGSIRRGLIAFDIANAIPAGSRITSVELTMNLSLSAGGGEPARVTLHRVLRDWGEGESVAAGGRGATAAKGDATWIYTFYDTQKWTRPGGDFVTGISAAKMVVDVGSYTWASTPQMVADVQAWLNKRNQNFGWIVCGNETRAATAKVFHSRESLDEAARPKLTVKFVTNFNPR